MATVADPGDGLAKGLAVEGPKVGAVPHLWRCLVRGATLGEGPADQHKKTITVSDPWGDGLGVAAPGADIAEIQNFSAASHLVMGS